uniref:Uncharacterized protein n=1 Tax=Trichuris muris TaxID=70415 RepID=A0A5S6QRW9_TRIMR
MLILPFTLLLGFASICTSSHEADLTSPFAGESHIIQKRQLPPHGRPFGPVRPPMPGRPPLRPLPGPRPPYRPLPGVRPPIRPPYRPLPGGRPPYRLPLLG